MKALLLRRDLELCRPIDEILDLVKDCVDPRSFLEPGDHFVRDYPVTNYHIQLIIQSRRFGHSDIRLNESFEGLQTVRRAYYAMIIATIKSKRSARLHGRLGVVFAEQEQGFADEILVEGVVHF